MTPYNELPPKSTRRRAALEVLLRISDIAIDLAVLAGGVFALTATPAGVAREVELPMFVAFWGSLLIIGGFSSALGRITGIWILETAGIASSACGALIYLAVVSQLFLSNVGLGITVCLILVALLGLLRRYVELQILLSEPGERGPLARLQALVRARTPASLRR